ncbi:MAG: hypothetical protein CM1200mP30_04030 [Pseudomonadota bacterium]|nr:MAG: hypothetical protein CM1200mP30_04030 [Pseudomonadota bacterium]
MTRLIRLKQVFGFTVPLKTKEDDFVGRNALINRKANPQKKLVGLELEGNEPAGRVTVYMLDEDKSEL